MLCGKCEREEKLFLELPTWRNLLWRVSASQPALQHVLVAIYMTSYFFQERRPAKSEQQPDTKWHTGMANAMESRRRWWGGLLFVTLTVGVTLVYLEPSSLFETSWLHLHKHPLKTLRESSNGNGSGVDGTMVITAGLPEILMNRVYSEQDFKNEKGIVPSFWEKQDSNSSLFTWGPCFPPNTKVDWNEALLRNVTDYHPISQGRTHLAAPNDLSDYCRPGFLIIGAGKCGTSSLYHYLTGHERVLPASEKQIHYFKYPMKWYLSHFPTSTSFLASGALMTGEASPGYLPYPDVAARTARMMMGAKIVAVGRNPLARAYSSYRYNYATPATDLMRRGNVRGVASGKSNDYYEETYLFSFEELLQAELTVLKECFAPGGPGEVDTKKKFGKQTWARDEYNRRKQQGLPPLIDLDGTCYGDKVSKTIPRKQWAELLTKFPEKFVNVPNLFLTQALLGRSLYVFPLEWWYMTFDKRDIYFICTEEMRDLSGEPMNQLAQFLGLPSYNFSSVVGEGMYNVGGHKGYNKEVTWEKVKEEAKENSYGNETVTDIPLSDEFRQELEDFIRPFNERLFQLVGRRCNW